MDLDRKILALLRERGSELSRPHEVEFYIYFRTEKDALEASPGIAGAGYHVQVLQDSSGDRWLCLARRAMVPTLGAIGKAHEELQKASRPFNGFCGGWATQVEH